jgi:hypothetical protein
MGLRAIQQSSERARGPSIWIVHSFASISILVLGGPQIYTAGFRETTVIIIKLMLMRYVVA